MPLPDITDPIVQYMAKMDAERERRFRDTYAALTERERGLVRDAAIMGYVQGTMAARANAWEIPRDAEILFRTITGCLSLPDIYTTLAGRTEDGDTDG